MASAFACEALSKVRAGVRALPVARPVERFALACALWPPPAVTVPRVGGSRRICDGGCGEKLAHCAALSEDNGTAVCSHTERLAADDDCVVVGEQLSTSTTDCATGREALLGVGEMSDEGALLVSHRAWGRRGGTVAGRSTSLRPSLPMRDARIGVGKKAAAGSDTAIERGALNFRRRRR